MSLKAALDGIREAKATQPQPRLVGTQAEARAALELQGTAKSKHPEFERTTVYLRKRTHKQAMRRYEDEQQGDFSDLVQELLERYLESGHG